MDFLGCNVPDIGDLEITKNVGEVTPEELAVAIGEAMRGRWNGDYFAIQFRDWRARFNMWGRGWMSPVGPSRCDPDEIEFSPNATWGAESLLEAYPEWRGRLASPPSGMESIGGVVQSQDSDLPGLLHFLSRMVPKQHREPFLSDLIEDRESMRARGHSETRVWIVTVSQIIWSGLGSVWPCMASVGVGAGVARLWHWLFGPP